MFQFISFVVVVLLNECIGQIYTAQLIFSDELPFMVNITVNLYYNIITITNIGKESKYYGIGFNSSQMDGTYAILFNINDNDVSEYILGNHSIGVPLESSVDVISVTDNDGIKITSIKTSLNNTNNAFSYNIFKNILNNEIPIIGAYGYNTTNGHHEAKFQDSMILKEIQNNSIQTTSGYYTTSISSTIQNINTTNDDSIPSNDIDKINKKSFDYWVPKILLPTIMSIISLMILYWICVTCFGCCKEEEKEGFGYTSDTNRNIQKIKSKKYKDKIKSEDETDIMMDNDVGSYNMNMQPLSEQCDIDHIELGQINNIQEP